MKLKKKNDFFFISETKYFIVAYGTQRYTFNDFLVIVGKLRETANSAIV